MTEKVVLTQEQAKALNFIKKKYTNSEILWMHAQWNRGAMTEWNKTLSQLCFEELYSALVEGYEAKAHFKEGDWVRHRDSRKINHIISVHKHDGLAEVTYLEDSTLSNGLVYFSKLVLATTEEIAEEQERRKWALLHRVPGEFRIQDVVRLKDGECFRVRQGVTHRHGEIERERATELYKAGEIMSLYPVDSEVEI